MKHASSVFLIEFSSPGQCVVLLSLVSPSIVLPDALDCA